MIDEELASFTSLLLPPGGGPCLELPASWALPALPDAPVVILVAPSRSASVSAAPKAIRRLVALHRIRLRPPRGWDLAIHPIAPAPRRRDPIGRFAKDLLGSGVVIELRRPDAPPSRLDAALAAAGATRRPGSRWHLGPGGALLGFVRVADRGSVLRAARGSARGPGTVAHGAAALAALADLAPAVPAPRLLTQGRDADVSWSLEEAIPGSTPRRSTSRLVKQVSPVLRALAQASDSPAATATADDVHIIATHLPALAPALEDVAARVATWSGRPVLRHGDLWSGNLLADDGQLAGIVDWDQWHPAAVGGTDLLQLLVTDERHRRRQSLGACWLERPWTAPAVRDHLEAADEQEAGLVALAWWATEVAGSLARRPALADDPRWVGTNVRDVLATLR